MKAITPDESGNLHIRLTRVQKKNLSALLYSGDNAWANSSVAKIEDVSYDNRLYVFHVPEELLDGSSYLMDVYNDGEFIKGYKVQTENKTPEPIEIDENNEKSFSLSETQVLTNNLLDELDTLVAHGYYYHDSILIPAHILEDIESLSDKLRNLNDYMEGEVAQDAFLLRSELSALKSTISRDNETIRRLNMRTKKIPLTPKQVQVLTTSVSQMIADALNASME